MRACTELAYSLCVFAEDTGVLDTFHAGGSCAGNGLVVDNILLKPEIWDAKPDTSSTIGGTFSEERKTSTRSMPLG